MTWLSMKCKGMMVSKPLLSLSSWNTTGLDEQQPRPCLVSFGLFLQYQYVSLLW